MGLLRMTLGCLLLLSGCFLANSPPLYRTDARKFLEGQQVNADLIDRLVDGKAVTAEEAEQLSRFDNTPVLHLLGSNESTPAGLIEKLARHPDEEVRTGVASNPNVSLELLLSLRTPGQYTTLNDYLSRNPRMPAELLLEMRKNGEASLVCLAMNPNCPRELMVQIAREGDELAKTYLAANPNLPADLMRQLEQDPSEMVRSSLRNNPNSATLLKEATPADGH